MPKESIPTHNIKKLKLSVSYTSGKLVHNYGNNTHFAGVRKPISSIHTYMEILTRVDNNYIILGIATA